MSGRVTLALDNSLDHLNLALGEEDRLLEERHEKQDRHSSEVLALRVRELLETHGHTARDLSLIIVTLGPGSFTGIRVGVAFCKGLAEGLGIPLVGVPTPDALAAPFAFLEGYYVCPLIDAKKGEVFFALYRVSEGVVTRIEDCRAVKPEEVAERLAAPCVCLGSGVRLCRDSLSGLDGVRMIEEGFQRVSGEALLKTGYGLMAKGEPAESKPIYGRRSEAEIKFNVEIP